MAYVRKRGNQLAIVHGERDAETGKVEQRILFTIYSKPEAIEAMGRGGKHGSTLHDLLAKHYPGMKLSWAAIRKGIAANLQVLPETYEYRATRVRRRFEEDMLAFVRQLALADGMDVPGATDPIREHRAQLEYVADLLRFRLEGPDQEDEDVAQRDPFAWYASLRGARVPVEAEEHAEEYFERREFGKARAAFGVLVACFPDWADGHNQLGHVAVEENRLEDAVQHFQRAVDVGRRLFPKRIGKRQYWSDHATRPYMRGLSYLAVTLGRLGKYDEALAVIDRLEKECNDIGGAAGLRAPVLLNAGRWREAAENAERVCQLWPEDSLVAGFAHFEMGDGERALAGLLHALVNRPRATRIILALPLGSEKEFDTHDHNAGVHLRRTLAAYLLGRPRASVRFFRDALSDPRILRIQRDVAAAEKKWHEVPSEARQVAGHIYHEALKPVAAARHAKQLLDLVPGNRRVRLLPPGPLLN